MILSSWQWLIGKLTKRNKNEDKFYYQDGSTSFRVLHGAKILHRVDGPAIEWADGDANWYVNGEPISVKDNEEFLRMMKLKAFW